jgi:hypothetical protein
MRIPRLTVLIVVAMCLCASAALATDEISAGSADLRIVGNDGDAVGAGVAVGDLNGDQVPDLAVGAPGG